MKYTQCDSFYTQPLIYKHVNYIWRKKKINLEKCFCIYSYCTKLNFKVWINKIASLVIFSDQTGFDGHFYFSLSSYHLFFFTDDSVWIHLNMFLICKKANIWYSLILELSLCVTMTINEAHGINNAKINVFTETSPLPFIK